MIDLEDFNFNALVNSMMTWENKHDWFWPEDAILYALHALNLNVFGGDFAMVKDILCRMKIFVIDDNGSLTDPCMIIDDDGRLNVDKHFWPDFLGSPENEIYQIGDKVEYVKLTNV